MKHLTFIGFLISAFLSLKALYTAFNKLDISQFAGWTIISINNSLGLDLIVATAFGFAAYAFLRYGDRP